MDFWTMGINADLNGLDAKCFDAPRFILPDQHCIRLELHAKHQAPGIFQDFEKVLANEDFAAAEGQNEHARLGHFVEQVSDLCQRHLAVIIVVQITMHAALVAAIGDIQLDAERDIQPQCLRCHLLHEAAHRESPADSEIGASESCRISCPASCWARETASCNATAGSTSNSRQMQVSTITSRGVVPSAACHSRVAVLLSVNKVESRPDMIIISPSRLRAATRGFRAT